MKAVGGDKMSELQFVELMEKLDVLNETGLMLSGKLDTLNDTGLMLLGILEALNKTGLMIFGILVFSFLYERIRKVGED